MAFKRCSLERNFSKMSAPCACWQKKSYGAYRRSPIPWNGRFDGVLRREVSTEQNGEAVGGRCHKADVHHYGIHQSETRGRLASPPGSVQADDPVFVCGRPLQLCEVRSVLSAFNGETALACA